jgi:hypothetical protein
VGGRRQLAEQGLAADLIESHQIGEGAADINSYPKPGAHIILSKGDIDQAEIGTIYFARNVIKWSKRVFIANCCLYNVQYNRCGMVVASYKPCGLGRYLLNFSDERQSG